MKKVQSCANCKALSFEVDTKIYKCELGVPLTLENPKYYDKRIARYVTVKPIVNCQKPRNNKLLIDMKTK